MCGIDTRPLKPGWAFDASPTNPRIPPVLVVLAAALLMWLGAWLVPAFSLRLAAARLVALVLLLVGTCVIIAALWSFRRVRTTVNPLAPHEASSLSAADTAV